MFVSERGISGPVERALRISMSFVTSIKSGMVGSAIWVLLLAYYGKLDERRKVIKLEDMFGHVKSVIVVVVVSYLRVLVAIVPCTRVYSCQIWSVAPPGYAGERWGWGPVRIRPYAAT